MQAFSQTHIFLGGIVLAYKIGEECIKCGACSQQCPVSCISEGEERFVIDADKCIDCGTCASVCPVDAPKSSE